MSDDIRSAIAAATKSVTKQWKQAKRQADRSDRVSSSALNRMRYRPPRATIKEVAFNVMETAYNKASGNGRYYANARQIMYAARPYILQHCDAGEFKDVYFTQTLLKDYLEEYRPGWKVVWDARGNLIEPHTNAKVSLGGLGVRRYLDGWHDAVPVEAPEVKHNVDTSGPRNRFKHALFIEKEGFAEILSDAGIGARFDMAIMSTKGLPVDAACDLIAGMHREGVKTFVLHDFDLAGFKILRTLKRGTRLSIGTDVIDLGLRLADLDELPAEPVTYSQGKHPRYYLRQAGATPEEIEFLVRGGGPGYWRGERVEINAMTSDQLVTWLESKFAQHGVTKVIPSGETLAQAYKRAVFLSAFSERLAELEQELINADLEVPDTLREQIEQRLSEAPSLSWDDALWNLVEDDE